jgi:hypothetical protein
LVILILKILYNLVLYICLCLVIAGAIFAWKLIFFTKVQ